jgi:hypothetical protein
MDPPQLVPRPCESLDCLLRNFHSLSSARITESYLSARALPTPQNHPIVAPAAYAPYLGASTLAPSSATLNTTHVNQTRLLSAQAVLPRRGSRRGGRPLGSTGRQGPSIAPEPALSMQSCTFQDSDGVWKFRITVQVYPPMVQSFSLTLYLR